MEELKYRDQIEPIEIVQDMCPLREPSRNPQPVTYGCCAESCSLKSFALFMVVGKVYRK